ncbi:MAG TPA: hypothetical protein VLL52_09700 [Anaerolineae bacterium]|nr:hypothetical protein [Anaerolineae bacterium]
MSRYRFLSILSPLLIASLLLAVIYAFVSIPQAVCQGTSCAEPQRLLDLTVKKEAPSAPNVANNLPAAPAPMIETAENKMAETVVVGAGTEMSINEEASLVKTVEQATNLPAMTPKQTVSLQYNRECFDLDTGQVISDEDDIWSHRGSCPTGSDFYLIYNSKRSEPTVLVLVDGTVSIGHTAETFEQVDWEMGEGLSYSTTWEDRPWREVTVMITGEGNRFKLRLVEDGVVCRGGALCGTVEWQALSPS